MGNPPRPRTNDAFERLSADDRSFLSGASELSSIQSRDERSTPADVLLALTYGAESEKALISLYGLTRSEAAFASKLVQGKSIEEVAQEMFISEHTARTHLKRIFMKADIHRQPELVLRLLMIVH